MEADCNGDYCREIRSALVEREVVKSESRREEKCQEEFEKLGELLDMDVLENQQYVALKKLMFEMRNQKYSYEEAIQKLYDILYLTLKCRGELKCMNIL